MKKFVFTILLLVVAALVAIAAPASAATTTVTFTLTPGSLSVSTDGTAVVTDNRGGGTGFDPVVTVTTLNGVRTVSVA